MTTTKRFQQFGSLVSFDFEGRTYTGEFCGTETARNSVPTYLVEVDGKVERISSNSPVGRSFRIAR